MKNRRCFDMRVWRLFDVDNFGIEKMKIRKMWDVRIYHPNYKKVAIRNTHSKNSNMITNNQLQK